MNLFKFVNGNFHGLRKNYIFVDSHLQKKNVMIFVVTGTCKL
jgi:hypothetical protein